MRNHKRLLIYLHQLLLKHHVLEGVGLGASAAVHDQSAELNESMHLVNSSRHDPLSLGGKRFCKWAAECQMPGGSPVGQAKNVSLLGMPTLFASTR